MIVEALKTIETQNVPKTREEYSQGLKQQESSSLWVKIRKRGNELVKKQGPAKGAHSFSACSQSVYLPWQVTWRAGELLPKRGWWQCSELRDRSSGASLWSVAMREMGYATSKWSTKLMFCEVCSCSGYPGSPSPEETWYLTASRTRSQHGHLHASTSCLLLHELHLWPSSVCSSRSRNQPRSLTLNCLPRGLACLLWAREETLLHNLFPSLFLRTEDGIALPSTHIVLPVY